jgi:hypothetical protein
MKLSRLIRRLWPTAVLALLAACGTSPDGEVAGASRGGTAAKARSPAKRASFALHQYFAVRIPPGAERVRAWIALPLRDDPCQQVRELRIESSSPHRIVRDLAGNEYVFFEVSRPVDDQLELTLRFGLDRETPPVHADSSLARPLDAKERQSFAMYLEPSASIRVDDRIRALASSVVGDEENPARVIERIRERLRGSDPSPTFGSGSDNELRGLGASLALAAGIPTRLVYESPLGPTAEAVLHDTELTSSPEVFVHGSGWIRLFDDVDASERAVAWSRGRELFVADFMGLGLPAQGSPAAHVEIDGRVETDWTRSLEHRQEFVRVIARIGLAPPALPVDDDSADGTDSETDGQTNADASPDPTKTPGDGKAPGAR